MNDKKTAKFCLLTLPRSGSSWFLSLLNSHPQVGAFGEAFLDRGPGNWADRVFLPVDRFFQFQQSTKQVRPFSTWAYMDKLIEDFSDEHRALGFKLMYQHLVRYPEILPKMIVDRYTIIHLVRENHLDVLISEGIMKKRGIAHNREETEIQPIHLDPSSLVRKLRWKRRIVSLSRFFLKFLPIPKIEVTYDALCGDPESILKKVTRKLSLPDYAGYESEFKKISKAPDWERIANYEEVRMTLKGTAFENLLDVQT